MCSNAGLGPYRIVSFDVSSMFPLSLRDTRYARCSVSDSSAMLHTR